MKTGEKNSKAKEVVRKMLHDKRVLNEHMSKGGKIKDLASKGIRVAKSV